MNKIEVMLLLVFSYTILFILFCSLANYNSSKLIIVNTNIVRVVS